MKRSYRRQGARRPVVVAVAVAVAAAVTGLAGCGGDGDGGDGGGKGAGRGRSGPQVVASTTWTGALAAAAGATDVTVITPAGTQSPARYRPLSAELASLADADFVVYAASDGFASVIEQLVREPRKRIRLTPSYAPDSVRADVTRLGRVFGTEATVTQWLSQFVRDYDSHVHHATMMAPIPKWTAVADVDLASWAVFADVTLAGTYGPAPADAALAARLAEHRPQLVLTDAHDPAEAPTIAGARRVDLISYPAGDLDLMAVYDANAAAIRRAFTG